MPNERPSDHDRPARASNRPARSDAPAAQPKPAGRKRRDPLPLPPLPPPCDTPPPGTLSITMRLHGPEEELISLIERLKRDLEVKVCMDAYFYLPDDAWNQFPPGLFTTIERNLVRADLRLSSYEEIMNTLNISRNTIHAYRTHIRSKVLSIEPQLRPAWMLVWLRLYPGSPATRRELAQEATQ